MDKEYLDTDGNSVTLSAFDILKDACERIIRACKITVKTCFVFP